jgi:hypothetical protein
MHILENNGSFGFFLIWTFWVFTRPVGKSKNSSSSEDMAEKYSVVEVVDDLADHEFEVRASFS